MSKSDMTLSRETNAHETDIERSIAERESHQPAISPWWHDRGFNVNIAGPTLHRAQEDRIQQFDAGL